MLQIREALDDLAVNLACDQITEEELEKLHGAMIEFQQASKTDDVKRVAEADVHFHDIIYQATRNPKLVYMLNNLREQIYRYRVEYLKDESIYPTLMQEHEQIIAGLRERDKEKVTRAMQVHVANQAMAVKEMIREQE